MIGDTDNGDGDHNLIKPQISQYLSLKTLRNIHNNKDYTLHLEIDTFYMEFVHYKIFNKIT